MSLAEKRRLEKAKEILKAHPDYVRVVLERVYGSGKVIANLVKGIAWLRGIERELDVVVLEHLVKNNYVAQMEGRRYGITIRGKKLIENHASAASMTKEKKVAYG